MAERDRLTVILAMIVAFLAGILIGPHVADSRELTAREYLTHQVNALRLDHDRDRLGWDQRLVPGATEVAERLTYDFSHSTSVELDLQWVDLGEAIGRAYDVEQIWDLLLASDAHRSMLMKRRWDRIGIGVVRAPLNDQQGLYVAIWVYDEGR